MFATVVLSGVLSFTTSMISGPDETPIIPRATIFGNPDRAGPQLSRDGSQISYLAPVDGVMNVWVAPVGQLAKARAVTKDTNRGVRQYFWGYDNRTVLYMQDSGGDENWHVFSANVDTGAMRDLTPYENTAAQVLSLSEKFPGEILVGLNDRDPQFHDVYRVNITTGERALVMQNSGFAQIVADDDYVPRLGIVFRDDGGMDIQRLDASGKGAPFESIPMEDAVTTMPIGFDASGKTLYMLDSRGRDTAALFAVDAATGSKSLLAEDAKADAGQAITHPKTGKVQAVSFTYDRLRWQVLDPAIKPDLDYLATVADGELAVFSRSLDDNRWIVSYLVSDGPARAYVYERAGGGKPGKATFLFTTRKSLEGQPLAKMHPEVITSRDGLNLVSYLTLPTWTDKDGDARPDRALPMVLLVHGGPWRRDDYGYDGQHQWLANRGYVVLSVNYRGSTGFGKSFTNAANMEWAAKMHDDLLDAVNWAVDAKVADKNKVAIMGGSYGGYATLVGLTFTPDVFACGVDIVGPSNLVTLLNTIPPYWAPLIEMFTKRVGDHRTEEGRQFLESRSPLTFVDRIKRPLLIGQGANDPRVKKSEADQIVAAMQARNIPVTYVLYPDEGHGFARPENRTSFNAIAEAFLAEHLGGRYEPIGNDLSGSSIEVPTGAEDVPGLSDSLSSAIKGRVRP